MNDTRQQASGAVVVPVDYLHSYFSHAHELRRVSLLLRERERFFDVSSKSGIDSDETVCHAAVHREYRVVLLCVMRGQVSRTAAEKDREFEF